MPTGFQAIGDNGSIQIDENYYNLTLWHTGTFTTNTNPYPLPGAGIGSVTVSCDPSARAYPLVALRCTTDECALFGGVKSGSSYTFYAATDNLSASVEYFVFDTPPSGGASFGLEVFDSAARRTFYSGHRHLRLIDFLSNPPHNTSRTYTSGRKYAVATGRIPYTAIYTLDEYRSAPFEESIMSAQITIRAARFTADHQFTILDSTIFNGFQSFPNEDLRGTFYSVDNRTTNHLVIDVTGY